jgi:multimeric flavodoxin WrbA
METEETLVAGTAIMIVTPVTWYQAPTALKSLIDRLAPSSARVPMQT